MRVRTQFSIASLVLVAVPCLVVGGIGWWTLNHTGSELASRTGADSVERARRDLVAGAYRERELVEALLRRVESEARSFATNETVASLVVADDEELLRPGQAQVRAGVAAAAASLDAQMGTVQQMLRLSLTLARQRMQQAGPLTLGEPREWSSTNQFTKAVTTVQVPRLLLGGQELPVVRDAGQAVPLVDGLGGAGSILCTIFQRQDETGSMLRVATNVPAPGGGRAIGTAIPARMADGAPNRVVGTALGGKTYEGTAWVVDRWCVTAYEPFGISPGQVDGMLFVGLPLRGIEGLNEVVLRPRIPVRGTLAVVDAGGRIALHPDPAMVGRTLAGDPRLEPLQAALKDVPPAGETRFARVPGEGKDGFLAWTRIAGEPWVVVYAGTIEALAEQARAERQRQGREDIELLHRQARMRIGDQERPLYSLIRVLDPAGRERVRLDQGRFVPDGDLRDHGGQPWFRAAAAAPAGRPVLSPVELGRIHRQPELRISVPLHRNGALAGMVVLNFDWSLVWEGMKEHRYGRTGYPFILGPGCTPLSHPTHTLTDLERFRGALDDNLAAFMAERIAAGKDGSAVYTFAGVEKCVGMVPMSIGGATCAVVASAPMAELTEVARAIEQSTSQRIRQITVLLSAATVLVVAAGVLLAVRLSRRFTDPVQGAGDALRRLADGDLSTRLPASGASEFQSMAGSFNGAVASVGDAARRIAAGADAVSGHAAGLSGVADRLGVGAAGSASQAGHAAESARQVSGMMTSLAAAVEQLGASVQEIARGASDAATKAAEGARAGEAASAGMRTLASLGDEIGAIVQVIDGIAQQVDLLSLNAAIEAASAGDAGRGFAVVAGEIKALARRAQEASRDVSAKVARIQEGVAANVQAVERTTGLVRSIDALQQSMAAATEEQAATTREMIGQIHHAAEGVGGIVAAADAVAATTRETDSLAGKARDASQELERLAGELRAAVGRFHIG